MALRGKRLHFESISHELGTGNKRGKDEEAARRVAQAALMP